MQKTNKGDACCTLTVVNAGNQIAKQTVLLCVFVS
jgi:hypothetical protein